ncbi:MAG: amidase [Actinobacteria bacterium]|nr:amidase [Actinomycetota bacterium]
MTKADEVTPAADDRIGPREAAAALRERRVSSRELTVACLRCAEETATTVDAFACLDPAGAIAAAVRADVELAAGKDRGSLHGIPVAVKELIAVAGLPLTAGSAVLAGAPPSVRDAAVVADLRRAGAVVVGTTRTHPFAMGVTTPGVGHPSLPGATSGGSSGGSAAAVAIGACLLALGTDTAGSVRIPAALCGVAGLVPPHGSLSREGVIPVSRSLDAVGVLAAEVADLPVVWRALAAVPTAAAVGKAFVLGEDELTGVAPAVRCGVDAVADRLGGVADRVGLDLRGAARYAARLVVAEALDAHRDRGWWPVHRYRYEPDIRRQLELAERLDPDDVGAARDALARLAARLVELLGEDGILVLPTTPTTAPALPVEDEDGAESRRLAGELTRFTAPFNALGAASASVPVGLDEAARPVGVQVVAMNEAVLLGALEILATEPGVSRR